MKAGYERRLETTEVAMRSLSPLRALGIGFAGAGVFVALERPLCWDRQYSPSMASREKIKFWEGLWNALLERLQRPVGGILLSLERSKHLGEPLLLRLVRQQGEAEEAETYATGIQEAGVASREYVAGERGLSGDQNRHRDPEDERYESNLNLQALQEKNGDGQFAHDEWGQLDRFLRPFGAQVLSRKGMSEEDEEEVFNEAFASLALSKAEERRAPIEELIVFEEVIPNFCRRLGFRAIDALRRRSSQKARPDHLQSLEELKSDEGSEVQVMDRTVADRERPDTWSFEEIYQQCREELSAVQWGLVYDLYVSQKYTVKDLIADREKLEFLGVDPEQSASTLRRRVEDIINPALSRLGDAMRL